MALQMEKGVRADQAADAALAMLLEKPRESATIEAVAERAGLTYWQVHRFHGNSGNLYRAAAARLIQKIEALIADAPTQAHALGDGVRRYTMFVAEVMRSEAYAQFAYLLIRDRCVEPLLEEAYETRIAAPLRAGLEKLVRSLGLRQGAMILLGVNSSRQFIKSLEAAFVLPRLLPGFDSADAETASVAIRRVADRVVAESYVLGQQAA